MKNKISYNASIKSRKLEDFGNCELHGFTKPCLLCLEIEERQELQRENRD
jgi:hypothetical protein